LKAIDQGFDTTKYQVIPRVLVFLFDTQDRVLLISGSDTKPRWPGKYNGLGGHVEAQENIKEAALRELLEEAGIERVDINLVGQIMINVSDVSGIELFIFQGLYKGDTFSCSQEGCVEWIKISDLPTLPTVEDLQVLVHKAKFHCPGDPIFIGKYSFGEEGDLEILWS